jgi:hypothetical protein
MSCGRLPLVAHKRKNLMYSCMFSCRRRLLAHILIHPFISSLRKEKDPKGIRTASATHFQRPSTSSGSPKKESQSPIILEALSGGEKSQGLPTANKMRRKRPSTFSLSNAYFQRPSTSSGAPKEPQSLFRDSKKEKEEKTSEGTLSTHHGTLRKRMSILAWRSGGPSGEAKSLIGAQGRSFYEQIGVPDHTGWMRKRADRYHIWNLRYFVLKGQRLYWFKTDDRSVSFVFGCSTAKGQLRCYVGGSPNGIR